MTMIDIKSVQAEIDTTTTRHPESYLDNLRKQYYAGTLVPIKGSAMSPTRSGNGKYVVRCPPDANVWALLFRFTREYPGFNRMAAAFFDPVDHAFNCFCTETQAQALFRALIHEIVVIQGRLGGGIKLVV